MNIGILLRESGRFYSDPLILGVNAYCASRGVGMTVFSIESGLPPADRLKWRDFFLERMGQVPIDAFICVSSTLALDFRDKVSGDMLEAIGDMPKVSIGVPLASTAQVSSDPSRGISELMDHMVVEHGFRRFGFIAGPDDNYESRRRFELFRDKLREYGLGFDEDCLFAGDYEHDSGGWGIDAFSDSGCLQSLDAILCANDHMALGAWQRLQTLGYEVPENIALVGFDDADLGLGVDNPLTTVSQGIRSLGFEAARSCHEAFLEGRPAEDVIIPTRMIVRGSCGCFPSNSVDTLGDRTSPEFQSSIEDFIERSGSFLSGPVPDLVGFRREWSSFARSALKESITIGDIHEIAKRLKSAPEESEFVIFTAMKLVLGIVGRERFIMASSQITASERLDQFGHRLFTLDDSEDYSDILINGFDALGFSMCMIGVLESRDGILDRIRPIACRRLDGSDGKPKLDRDGTFPASRLLPDGMRKNEEESLIVLPLGRGADARGFAVLDFNPKMMTLYSGITSRLSMSMRIWSNIENLENEVELRRLSEAALSETVLRDELTGLYNRRGFLLRAKESLELVRVSGGFYAVVYSDLDGLKVINDRWGHAAGDEALEDAAVALKRAVRDKDIVARLGGDEFALFVFLGKENRGDSLESRLRDSVVEIDTDAKKRGREWTFSMSFGVLATDDRKESLDRLMAEADGIQYREKERKRAERQRRRDESFAG